MNITKSSFYPKTAVEKLSNVKRYYKVSDQKIIERVLLDIVDSREREKVIFLHFMRNYAKIKNLRPIRFCIISRDSPWDFEVELSNGEAFKIEITSISDGTNTFRKLKNEERVLQNMLNNEIPLHELEKVNKLFPDKEIQNKIAGYLRDNNSSEALVINPYYHNQGMIFISKTGEKKELIKDLIMKAVKSKEAKKHSDKENTILIIDNRTQSYEYNELYESMTVLNDFYLNSPFKEIWFYTGYGSDLDGNNADFSLVPLKISDEYEDSLIKLMNNNKTSENSSVLVEIIDNIVRTYVLNYHM